VVQEVKMLGKRLTNGVTYLDGSRAMVSKVLEESRQHTWVHLACHAIQDPVHPTNSAFLLHDGILTLSELITAPTVEAELAFLSACETATGDNRMPDEAVHLAAGMLAAGYKGVVGTMWAIGDEDAPLVADTFYSHLLSDRQTGLVKHGQTGAAYALDEAVRVLRENVGEDNFARWAPFVHFGV
jgi:CHAT domain-containing protein